MPSKMGARSIMKISLMVLSTGSAAGKTLPVTAAQFIIGRDPGCNLRPASAMISKRHCAIIIKNGKVSLRDFDSTNGTFVNDQQIKGEVPLKDGDVLKVGPLSFKVVIEGVPAVTKPTPPPKPKSAEITDEDAAAALLSIDDETGNVSVSNAETAEDQVPGGSTVMDMPAFAPTEDGAKTAEGPAAAAKPDEKKPVSKGKQHAQGAAQDAAKAILEKLRQGKRK
jgi:pSer/pThr/pTyr-binding forkhead associated (FHA) protein